MNPTNCGYAYVHVHKHTYTHLNMCMYLYNNNEEKEATNLRVGGTGKNLKKGNQRGLKEEKKEMMQFYFNFKY